jgi:hypothetical protein
LGQKRCPVLRELGRTRVALLLPAGVPKAKCVEVWLVSCFGLGVGTTPLPLHTGCLHGVMAAGGTAKSPFICLVFKLL